MSKKEKVEPICENCCRWFAMTTLCVLWQFPHAATDKCEWFLPREDKDDQKKDDTWGDST